MNALRSVGLWAYEFHYPAVVDDRGRAVEFRIPPLPASEWIIASLQPGHLGYVPGLLPDDQKDILMQALEDGLISLADMRDTGREALEEVSGWSPWWGAGRLIGMLAGQFETLGGLLVLSGVDMSREPLGAVLAALHARIWIEASKEDRSKLAQELATPPPDMLTAENWDEDAATAAVWAFMQAGRTGIDGS